MDDGLQGDAFAPTPLSWDGGFDPLPAALAGGLAGYPGDLGPQAYLNADERTGTGSNGKPSLTIDQAAQQIDRTGAVWPATYGQGFSVTYAYRSTAPAAMPSDIGGFQRFSTAQINETEFALKAWSDVANIHFIRVGYGTSGDAAYSDSATILLGDYSTGQAGASAFSYYPGPADYGSSAGDVWVNSTFGYNSSPMLGNYGGMVLVHELGHAIGLAHPSDYNASADVTLSYANDASYYEDDRQYTVMSYFSEGNTGATFGGTFASAPLLDDIAAAQLLYGANTATRAGDTVYGFHATADEPWFVADSSFTKLVFAVWDAGGTDTFDFSGYGQNQLIDLKAGDFSNVGGLIGNVAIAENATIENAIGGVGADVIHGNAANNSIQGGAGGDTIDGGGTGADTLVGGSGDDSIIGGDGADSLDAGLGNNTILAGAGNDTVTAANSTGQNTLYAGEGDDVIYGGTGANSVNGNKGQDTIVGKSTVGDQLFGGQGNDQIDATASSGHNYLNGNLGDDVLRGGSGGDTLRGGQGDDNIVGGAGGDWLSGDMGRDTLTGGGGADVFHVQSNNTLTVITDFSSAQGDRIELEGGSGYTTVVSGGDTVITVGLRQVDVLGVTSLPAGSILLA